MRKWLVIFAIAAIAAGVAGQAGKGTPKNESARTANPQSESQDHNQDKPKTPSVIVQVSPQPANAPDASEEKNTQRKLAVYTLWLVFFTAVLAGVSMVQGYFLRQQANHLRTHAGHLENLAKATDANAENTGATLLEIQRQADLMDRQTGILEKSVAAAQKSIDNAIIRDRAYVTISAINEDAEAISPDGKAEFRWEIRNVGKTPAILIEAKARFVLLSDGESLPEIPDYGNPRPLQQRFLAPDKAMEFSSEWAERKGDGEYIEMLRTEPFETEQEICGFGYVKYRSAFNSAAEICESRFCDLTSAYGNVVERDFAVHHYAPEAYIKYT